MTNSKPDLIARVKRRLRQNRFLSYFIGCPYPAPRWNRCVKRLIRQLGPDANILDLGAGNRRHAANVINLETKQPGMTLSLMGIVAVQGQHF